MSLFNNKKLNSFYERFKSEIQDKALSKFGELNDHDCVVWFLNEAIFGTSFSDNSIFINAEDSILKQNSSNSSYFDSVYYDYKISDQRPRNFAFLKILSGIEKYGLEEKNAIDRIIANLASELADDISNFQNSTYSTSNEVEVQMNVIDSEIDKNIDKSESDSPYLYEVVLFGDLDKKKFSEEQIVGLFNLKIKDKLSIDAEISVKVVGEQQVLRMIDSQTTGEWAPLGELIVDDQKNVLHNLNLPNNVSKSIVCNISANSLRNLWDEYQHKLLSLNLRYYVKNSGVDKAIDETIEEKSDLFWFKNNGLVILCSNYTFEGNVLQLQDFSIVNGGQTTTKIGNSKFDKDFFLTCKVIALKDLVDSTDENDKEMERASKTLAKEISVATNQQKPINNRDLVSNDKNLLKFKEIMDKNLYGPSIYIESRRGEIQANNSFFDKLTLPKEKTISSEEFLKLYCTFDMIAPGWGRSKNTIYQPEKVGITVSEMFKKACQPIEVSYYKELIPFYYVLAQSKLKPYLDEHKNIKEYGYVAAYGSFFFIAIIKLLFVLNDKLINDEKDEIKAFLKMLQNEVKQFTEKLESVSRKKITKAVQDKKIYTLITDFINSEFEKLNIKKLFVHQDTSSSYFQKNFHVKYANIIEEHLGTVYRNAFNDYKKWKAKSNVQESNFSKTNNDFYYFFLPEFIKSISKMDELPESYKELFNLD